MAENAEQKQIRELFEAWMKLNVRIFDLEGQLRDARLKDSEMRVELLRRMRMGIDNLTFREREVLVAVQDGKSNKEIGAALSISERTVKFHVSRILAKYNRQSRHDL